MQPASQRPNVTPDFPYRFWPVNRAPARRDYGKGILFPNQAACAMTLGRRIAAAIWSVEFMRLGIVIIPSPLDEAQSTAARAREIGRRAEALGFSGLWVTDAFGRGFPTVDPLQLLSMLAGVTSTVELGTCVLQLPLRHPVELAHRVASLDQLSERRLRLGIGAGSTEADFLAVEADYASRFRTLPQVLESMRQTWRGEADPRSRALALAGRASWTTGDARGLAQPALDRHGGAELRRLDRFRHLYDARGSGNRDRRVPRGRRQACRARQHLHRFP